MFLYLLYPLHESVGFFNVFRYITFRTFGASITAVVLSILLGPAYIRFLQRMQMGQVIRNDGPQSHLSKKGTPTMGGGLILIAICVSTLLWADLTNKNIWISLVTTMLFGVVGFVDDYKKVVQKNPKGISARQKLLGQTIIALLASYLIYVLRDTPPVLKFPFLKDVSLYLGPFFVLFSTLVIVGASNAVNLTDGLDGRGPDDHDFDYVPDLGLLCRSREDRRVLADPAHPGCGRACRVPGVARCLLPGISLVQYLSRSGVHGRRGLALVGCGSWRRGRNHQKRDFARYLWWNFCIGSFVSPYSSGFV